MKRKAVTTVLSLLLVFATAVTATGCAASQTSSGKSAGDYKMVLLLPGPINDQSWNATNYAGLQAANQSLGTKIEYVENVQAADFESTFRNYAERGYDMILAAGTQFDDAANKVAKDYPKTTFTVINGQVANGANVAPVLPKEYEGSYLAGIIAGYTTQNGQFATIGGFPNDLMAKLLDTYEKEAVKIATERGIKNAKAVRAYANSWDDVALGKQMAETMIGNGADTLFVYANQVGLGSIQAAKEKGVNFIGFASDQNSVAPGTVIASVVEDFQTLYTWAVGQFLKGQLTGNTVHEVGVKEGFFKVSYTDKVSADVRSKVAAAMDDISNGKVDFTSMFEKK